MDSDDERGTANTGSARGMAKGEGGAQADAFRERIVQASTELIREQGLSALSMREVARRAGVSHQAPYYYFADREAIIGAIAEQGFAMMREYVQRSVPERAGAPHDAIMAAGHAYLEFAFAHPAHFRVMFRPELVSPERHPNVQDQGLRACDTFYRIVSEAVAAGLPAEPGVDALFLLCWSLVHGLACLVLDGPLDVVMPNMDRQAQLRDVMSTFSRMVEASIAQAKLQLEARGSARERDQEGAAGSKRERGAQEPAKTRKGARPTSRAKKASDTRR
jgi:AcrR family transcriptional regulator